MDQRFEQVETRIEQVERRVDEQRQERLDRQDVIGEIKRSDKHFNR